MTSRQRAYLKSLASKENAIFQVGKASVTPDLTKGISQALKARELVKISVLKNCMDDPKEITQMIGERTKSQVIQIIGKKIVFYKPSKENPKILLPKDE